LASAWRQLGEEDRAAELLTDVLAAYRQGSNLRGELSTLDERSELHRRRGEADTAPAVARQAHGMALTVGDRKATAQFSATTCAARAAETAGHSGVARMVTMS